MEKGILGTDQFRIVNDHLLVLRKNFVITQIPFSQISDCQIKNGSSSKNPILMVVFGLVCCLPLILWIVTWREFLSQDHVSFFQILTSSGQWRALAIQLTVVGFCFFMGLLSFRQALTKIPVREFQTAGSKRYRFDLTPLEKNNKLEELISLLKDHRIIV
jgi:hypothetical protein